MLKSFMSFILSLLLIGVIGCDNVSKVLTPKPVSTVKIGFIVAGDRANYLNGAEMAVSEINGRGGLFGMPVELMSYINMDSGPEVSVEVAESMIVKDKVIALIGPNRSSHAVEVGRVAQKHQIPMIATTATNPNVTGAGDFVFMASFTDSFQGAAMARFAKMELGLTTAAIMTRRGDLYTEGISEFFMTHFIQLGGKATQVFYEAGTTDFTSLLEEVAGEKPDALFAPGFVDELPLLTQQAHTIGLQNSIGTPTVFLGSDSWDNPLLLTTAATAIEGSYFTGHFSPDADEPNVRTFVDTYTSIYGDTPVGGIAVSYDAVILLALAAEKAGSYEPNALRQQLAATQNYIGVTSIAHYDENRHPTKSVVIFTIKNGKKLFYKQVN